MNIALSASGTFSTYLRACNAMWRVCYDSPYPIDAEPEASLLLDGNRYDIKLVASGARHIRFEISTVHGDAETKARLEARLVCAYIALVPPDATMRRNR